MKVVYTSPNRSHHYKYAIALNTAGYLKAFISGFPRISPRSNVPELEGKLKRADLLQTIFILSLKLKVSKRISKWLAFLSKKEQDLKCRKFLKNADIFLFYNGSGYKSSKYCRKLGVTTIVEAVNSHLEYQEELLQEEYEKLELEWQPLQAYEKVRRLAEYDEADYILMPSEFVRRSFIAKGFPEKKLLKVNYGFNRFEHSPQNLKEEYNQDIFTVLYVGSISVRKGIRYLIEAFKNLSIANKRLVLVGPNPGDGALKGVELTSDITFTGVLKGKDLEQAYTNATIFCLPTLEEGLALVLGEALSFGLPIITTENSGADDIIEDSKEGFIVPIRNSEALRQKMELLANDRDLLHTMRQNSGERSKNLNGWEASGNNLVATLKEVYETEKAKKQSL